MVLFLFSKSFSYKFTFKVTFFLLLVLFLEDFLVYLGVQSLLVLRLKAGERFLAFLLLWADDLNLIDGSLVLVSYYIIESFFNYYISNSNS